MTSKIVVNNIEADAGISTVTFASEVTAPTFNGNIVGTSATFSGNVSVGGALTYEDVTNVDSVGIVTARSGIHVTGGKILIDNNEEFALFEDDTSGAFTPSSKISMDFSGNVARIRSSVNGVATIRDLAFYTGNSDRLHIKSDGNIGIGTTNPAHKLDVLSSAFPTARLRSTYTTSSKEYNSLYFGIGNVNQTTQIGHVYDTVTPTNSFFHVTPYGQGEGGTFSVLANRNIGIGLTNPSAKLHIKTSSGTDTPGSTNSHLLFDLADDGGPSWVQRVWDSGAGTLGLDGSFAIDRRYSGVWTNAITIKRSDGNIGIGTYNPAAKLEVKSGKIRAGEAGATNGSTIIEGYYTGSNVLNILGSHYSNGATVLSYGMRPKNGSSGYVSSFANFSGPRTALEMWGEGAQIVTAPAQQTAVGSDLTNVTGAVMVRNNGDVTMRGTDSQYLEMAAYRTNNGLDIRTNDTDVLEWTELSNTNPSVISHSSSPNPSRITFTVAGVVHVTAHQDIITSGSTGYAQMRIMVNGNIYLRQLMTNTNGEWDNIGVTAVLEVSANDYIEISVSAADITSWDDSGWSSYNFIFAPINTDR